MEERRKARARAEFEPDLAKVPRRSLGRPAYGIVGYQK